MKISDVKKNAFAMPVTNPVYSPGPYRFVDRRALVVTYRTDPKALKQVLPEPLTFEDPLVQYEFTRVPASGDSGEYVEAGQTIPVMFNSVPGTYVHSTFVNEHAPLAGGREIWGFPKKPGEPSLSKKDRTLIGNLDGDGARIASATMRYSDRPLDKVRVRESLLGPNFMLKVIPHVDCTPRICELVRYYLEDLTVKEAWEGEGALTVHGDAPSDVAALPVLEVVSSIYFVADMTIGLGEVVYDYMVS